MNISIPAPLRAWFEQLASRERVLVLAAGALAVFAIVVMGGFRPLITEADRGREMIDDKQALLREIGQVAQRLGPQRGDAPAAVSGGGQSLVLVVDKTTRQLALDTYLKRNQPDGESSIRLRFENAPFDTLTNWLGQLETQYGLTINSANIDVAAQPGRVNCNLTLDRVGA